MTTRNAQTAEAPWNLMTFDRTTEARGRNGWFVLHDGHIHLHADATWQQRPAAYLHLEAKLKGKNAPIALHFAGPDDMETLGRALLAAAQSWQDARGQAGAS